MFIDIQGGNLDGKLTIGNIYRPPKNNNSNACVKKFLNELSPIISKLCKNNNNTVITGDMSLDLLKIDEREKFQAYFDLFVTHSFFPQIMYPTRISQVQSHRSARNKRKNYTRMTATLIDQMFCRLKDISKAEFSGIILSAMPDHFPYFSVLDIMKKKDHKPKFVEIRNNDATSFALFQNEVASAMASHVFENALFGDPNKNCSIFEDIISNAKHKHLQPKTVRFKRYKHKLSPWMTKGILVSIKLRDKLFCRLKSTQETSPHYAVLKYNLSEYKTLLKKIIRLAKTKYYDEQFDKNKANSRLVWATIIEIKLKMNHPVTLL